MLFQGLFMNVLMARVIIIHGLIQEQMDKNLIGQQAEISVDKDVWILFPWKLLQRMNLLKVALFKVLKYFISIYYKIIAFELDKKKIIISR